MRERVPSTDRSRATIALKGRAPARGRRPGGRSDLVHHRPPKHATERPPVSCPGRVRRAPSTNSRTQLTAATTSDASTSTPRRARTAGRGLRGPATAQSGVRGRAAPRLRLRPPRGARLSRSPSSRAVAGRRSRVVGQRRPQQVVRRPAGPTPTGSGTAVGSRSATSPAVSAGNGRRPGQQQVGHGRDRVHVGAHVEPGLLERLLRRHEGRGARR